MNKKIGLTAIAGAMALAACGQGPQPGVQQGNLTVNTAGLPANTAAPVTIVGEGQNRTLTVTNSQTVQLPRGSYTITAGAVSGFNTPAAQTVTVGENSSVTVTYTAVAVTPPPVVQPPVQRVPTRVELWNGSGSIVTNPTATPVQARVVQALRDENGVFLPGRVENNVDKEAYLFASQTEEDVCVTVRVTDAAGNVVNNSRVKIEVTGVERGSVSVQAGCTASASGNVATPLNTDEVLTDANGIARFTLFSTFEAGVRGEPVKVVVRAADQAGQNLTPALEFKMFFLNMTHLYAQVNNGPLQRTTQRTGQVFNVADIFLQNQNNDALLRTWTYQKQPRQGPIAPQNFYGGFVAYTLSGADANLVRFVRPDGTVVAGTTYIDTTGAGVTLRPVGVTRDRLVAGPVDARVTATYVFSTQYGATTYEFGLKNYSIDRRLQGTFLNIAKSINNRVLTWRGPARTLAATGAVTQEPYVARVTVSANNIVSRTNLTTAEQLAASTAYNVNLRDVLPAELGYAGNASARIVRADGSAVALDGAGVTYDATVHAVNLISSTAINLAPGERVEMMFDVYARQKPGFSWTALAPRVDAGARPLAPQARRVDLPDAPYLDPYRVTNGDGERDVTASYLPQGSQQPIVEEYNPTGDESDIWVVRPLYTISKTAVQSTVEVGALAQFRLQVRVVDRAALDAERRAGIGAPLNPGEVGYDQLRRQYPFEFFNPAVGDVAPTEAQRMGMDWPRSNPYSSEIRISDVFADSLDFARGTEFTNPRAGVVSGLPTPNTNVVGKNVNWTIDASRLFQGETATANLFLNTNVAGRAENCAFLRADQLNQPALVGNTGRTVEATRGPQTSYQPGSPWPQISGWTEGLVPAGFQNAPGTPAANALISCAAINVVQARNVRLTFTNRGEFTDNTPNLIDANKRDGFSAATSPNFFYKFDSQNVGNVAATGVRVTFVRDNNNVLWVPGGQYVAYNSVDGLAWNPIQTVQPVGNVVTFNNITVPAGGFVRFVLEGDPNRPGITNVDGILTYTETNGMQSELSTQEVTTVIP